MKLNTIFQDNMVLQAGKPIVIAGTGKGNLKISLAGRKTEFRIDDEKWAVKLGPFSYGGPYTAIINLNEEKLQIKNIMIGEVFLCAGQSNMQFTIGEEQPSRKYESDPMLRTYVAERIEAYEGIKSADGWVQSTTENICFWSAIGYHLARSVRKFTGAAVGIVGCWQGASIIQSWIRKDIISRKEYFIPNEQMSFNEKHNEYKIYSAWNGFGMLHDRVFSKIAPYTFSNVIWYQGESNASIAEGKMYVKLLGALISSWREELLDPELPFIVVQICDFDNRQDEGWKLVQKAQEEAENILPGVKTVISSDVCSHEDIHPANKIDLSEKIYHAVISETRNG